MSSRIKYSRLKEGEIRLLEIQLDPEDASPNTIHCKLHQGRLDAVTLTKDETKEPSREWRELSEQEHNYATLFDT